MEKSFEQRAEELIQGLCSNPVNKVFYVNDKMQFWINNDQEQMEAYFASRKEKFVVIENFTAPEVKEESKKDKPEKKAKK